MGVITLSRQHGAGGEEFAESIAARIGYCLIAKNEIEDKLIQIAGKEIPERLLGEKRPTILERLTVDLHLWKCFLEESILSFARDGNALILGRGGFKVLQGIPGVLHLLATGSRKSRSEHISSRKGIASMDADREIEISDRERTGFLQYFFNASWPDPSTFHISVTPLMFGTEKATEAVNAFIGSLNLARDYDRAGKDQIARRYALAAGKNRVVLSAQIAPDLFELAIEGDGEIGIQFFNVPDEKREKAVATLGEFLKGYRVKAN